MLKNIYKVKFRHGLVGDALVTAFDEEEAVREAFSLCRFTSTCVPRGYGPRDVIESIEPAGDCSGKWGYSYRPVSEKPSHEDYARMLKNERGEQPSARESAV